MKNSIKYLNIVLLLLIIQHQVKGQSVGIASGGLTVSPTPTIANTSTVSVSGYFQNTGSAILSGSVTVNMAINTSTNTTPNYVFRTSQLYTVSSFTPSSIYLFNLTDNASGANQYRTDGNGTTVVVWPVYNGIITSTSDSAFITVTVILNNSIEEINTFESAVLKINNPIWQPIELKYDPFIYKNVELLDVSGRVVQIIQNQLLNTILLSKGLYYLNFYHSLTGKVITKKIIIE